MGVRFPSVSSNSFVGPLPANANETVVLTTPPLTVPLDFAPVTLLWYFCYLAGTGNTAALFNIRRGTTVGGALVSVAPDTSPAVAGAQTGYSGIYFDVPGAVAGQQYSLTIQQFAATAAGQFKDGAFIAFAL